MKKIVLKKQNTKKSINKRIKEHKSKTARHLFSWNPLFIW